MMFERSDLLLIASTLERYSKALESLGGCACDPRLDALRAKLQDVLRRCEQPVVLIQIPDDWELDARYADASLHFELDGEHSPMAAGGAPIVAGSSGQSRRQPVGASKLLYTFLPARDRDYTIGDLDETYTSVNARFGADFAWRWYWYQAIRTLAWYPLHAVVIWIRDALIGTISRWISF